MDVICNEREPIRRQCFVGEWDFVHVGSRNLHSVASWKPLSLREELVEDVEEEEKEEEWTKGEERERERKEEEEEEEEGCLCQGERIGVRKINGRGHTILSRSMMNVALVEIYGCRLVHPHTPTHTHSHTYTHTHTHTQIDADSALESDQTRMKS